MTTPAPEPGDLVTVLLAHADVVQVDAEYITVSHPANCTIRLRTAAPGVTVTPHADGGAEGLDVDFIRDAIGEALSNHYDNQGLHPAIAKPFDAADAVMPIVGNIIADRDSARAYSAKLTAELKKARRPMTVEDEFEDLKSNMIYANAMDRAVDAALGVAKQRDALLAELDRLRAPAEPQREDGCYDCANNRTRRRLGMSSTECAQHPAAPAGIEAAIVAGIAAAFAVAKPPTPAEEKHTTGIAIAAIRAAAVHLDAGCPDHEAKIGDWRAAYSAAAKQCRNFGEALSAARAHVADLEAENARLKSAIDPAELARRVAAGMDLIAANKALEGKIEELRAEVAELQTVCNGCEHPREAHLADGCGASGIIWNNGCPCPATYADGDEATS